jgi:hypothetical protein
MDSRAHGAVCDLDRFVRGQIDWGDRGQQGVSVCNRNKVTRQHPFCSLLPMHKVLHGGIGRVVFGNEKVRINIGTIDETSPSDIAHGESERRCTHRCRYELFVMISHSLFLMCESLGYA